jgi:dihydrolipoamide dehydrogenase
MPNLAEQVESMMREASEGILDVVVIGGGPGGYVAAIRAAQLGGKVALVEKAELGGVCLNRGCIPTKAMLASAYVYDVIARRSSEFGIDVKEVSLDYTKVVQRRDRIVKTLVSGVGFLMRRYNVQVVRGTAKLASRNEVEVEMQDGSKQILRGRNIIIATGSTPSTLAIPGLDGDNVWDSDGALAATEVPSSLLIIGGGYIGVEWSYIFSKLGCNVTVVELTPEILPSTDKEVAAELRKALEKDGVKILTNSTVKNVEHRNGKELVTVISGSLEQQIEVEKILVAVGRKPASEGLGLESVGVATEQGRILVNDKMQTNVPGIYAIGDVVGGALLAHKASEEGVVAAENCMGRESKMHYHAIPGCIYTTPEVATVGLTEEVAKNRGIEYKVGKFFFRPNGKALGIGETTGFVKFIADAKYGEILGCHMIGPHVTDLIQEVVVAINSEATIETIARSIHAHPTLSEVVREAALDVNGESLHKG